MRRGSRGSGVAVIALASVVVPAGAQVTVRDSAGITITASARPLWPAGALRLGDTPRLVLPRDTGAPSRPVGIRLVAVLSTGRIAVADGGSGQLRLFDSTGTPVTATPLIDVEGQQLRAVRRIAGDAIAAIVGRTQVVRFSGTGTRLDSAAPDPAGRPRSMVTDVLPSGHHVQIGLTTPEPHATGQIWAEETHLSLRHPVTAAVTDLGPQPMVELEQTATSWVPRWLGPVAALAGTTTHVYLGYGSQYEIRAYTHDNRLRRLIRRAWTPVPITDADWETWVVEWSKRWVKTTGEERAREIQAVRDSPWATTLPAFSQFLTDRTGRLWVRQAHWQDAIGDGSLNSVPAVPSEWSVFDTQGRWVTDVTMPAQFQPFEIGADYVAGRQFRDGRERAVVYPLIARTP